MALDAFRSTPDDFDVLIADFRMPGMSGDKLIREVRSLRPLLHIIMVSGSGDTAALAPSNAWADDVLTKPLRTDALATSLARILAAA